MPFTPFHFCPGLLAKAFSPRYFWLTSFVLANVLIDLEVLYYLSKNDPPIHRYLHTYLGGIFMGVFAGLLMFGVIQIACRVLPAHSRWRARVIQAPKLQLLWQSLIAGLIGGVTHIFLDSLMHEEMNPFWPIADGNGLAGMLSVGTLHIGLAAAGLFSLIFWLLLRES
ncbi:DUF4184 family protein [Gimesia aquarii]|uniref:DUF4184 family protein n=1 Tax=Gimesia aquarii TaxID=2527964 RepID=UPI0011A1A112|nr:DUF4184 family protein [Gimesia aquarii]